MKSLNGKILIDIDLFERIVRPALEIERKKLEIELAKTILFLDALERDDLSNLGESLIEEFNKVNEQVLSDYRYRKLHNDLPPKDLIGY